MCGLIQWKILDGEIRFREHAPDGEEPGEFYFKDIGAKHQSLDQ